MPDQCGVLVLHQNSGDKNNTAVPVPNSRGFARQCRASSRDLLEDLSVSAISCECGGRPWLQITGAQHT